MQRGRAREQELSWRRTAERTVECYRKAVETAANGTSPRERPSEAVRESLRVIARYKYNDAERELAAWQHRCHGAEGQLRRALDYAKSLEAMLQELGRKPAIARPEISLPPMPATGAARPRWSVRRRMQKIRDGIRRRFGG